jgi:DNA repair protein RadC
MCTYSPAKRRHIRRVVSTLEEVVAEGPLCIGYREPMRGAEVAYSLVREIVADRATEEFWAILLDAKNRPIGLAQISIGCLTWTVVHPREVYGPAVRLGAGAVIVAHNHPSGDPEPSTQDITLTERLASAGELLGIPLLDHLVCGDKSFVSLRTRGVIK